MPGYTVTAILTGGQADAINNNATPMMVGVAYDVSGNVKGFIFKAGALTFPAALSTQGYANAVNNHGIVVGRFGSSIGSGRAFSYTVASGAVLDLQAKLGVASGEARDINNNDLVVGGTWNGSARGSFLYDLKTKTLTNILPPGAFQSIATAINDNNQVVGIMWPTADPYAGHQAYLYDHGTGATAILPGGVSPYGIDKAGIIVGGGGPGVNPVVCSPPGYVPAVIGPNAPPSPQTSNGTGVAYGINTLGDVVGEVGLGAQMHGFIYSLSKGTFQDLNALITPPGTWQVIIATAINDKGSIVASARNLSSGAYTGVLLTPF